MQKVNLFGIALDYQPQWELHFGRAPTDRVGGFELLLKKDYQITNAICVIWRPCDEGYINTFLDSRHNRAGLARRILPSERNRETTLKVGKAGELPDADIVALYCDGVYKSITKEQGPVTMVRREKQQVNTHAAEISEFTFPVNKRSKSQGNIYRVQLVLKCNISKRFVALYTSSRDNAHNKCSQIERIFESLRCH